MAFLVFEGIDGSGKSSLIQGLKSHLESQKYSVVVTREPGGTPLGEELRQVLLRTQGSHPLPRAELLLYEAIRAQHVDELIQPALKANKWVLCDRFTASSVAFQAAGRALKEEDIVWLNNFATDRLRPKLTILLDLAVEAGASRRMQRSASSGTGQDRLELEKQDFHERVRASYLKQAQANPHDWLVLNAENSQAELLQRLLQHLQDKKWLVS